MDTVTLKVDGMTCGGCVASVTRVLQAVPGVGAVQVELAGGTATVNYDAARTTLPALKLAIEGAGYDVAS